MPPSLGSTHPNSTVSTTTTATTTSAPPCLCEQGGEKVAPPFGCGSGEVHIQRRMGGAVRMGVTLQAPLPPFACRGAMQMPCVGCPSLHPFPLPHDPHWGHAQPKGGTRSRGTKGKCCPSPIACEHNPVCHPACMTPACPTFGCQACAWWHPKVGRAGVVHVGRCTGLCSHPLPCRGGECPPHICLLCRLRHSPPRPAEGTGALCACMPPSTLPNSHLSPSSGG